MHQLWFQPSVADIFALSASPDLYDHLLWQRASPLKPSPSLTTSAAHPESCPSRRAPRCCCISERQKTGGRDGTMESMAWCHTSISWSRMCECLFCTILNVMEQHTIQLAHKSHVWLTTKLKLWGVRTWHEIMWLTFLNSKTSWISFSCYWYFFDSYQTNQLTWQMITWLAWPKTIHHIFHCGNV